MAENGENGAAAAGNQQQLPEIQMRILGQFIRDLSFENVLVQKPVAGSDIQPDVNVQVNLDAKRREGQEKQFEVSVKLNIESRAKGTENVLFLLEIDYGGFFFIDGVPDEQLHAFLLIECPRMLFPYLRRIVSDVTRDGGFPPLNMDPIDFVALYRAELARRQAAEQGGQTANA